MSLIPVSLDYTNRDFTALRTRLFALIRSAFPTWTDENAANFGNILVELFAHVGDVLSYYQDNQALEAFISTATQRRSLLALCKLIGYRPATASAAQANVTFSIASVAADNVVIPAGDVFSTPDVVAPVRFQLLEDVVIGIGQTSTLGVVENSEDQIENFESTELASQELVLGFTPYLDGATVVVAANGTFTEVESFLDSTSTDKHFITVVDQNDRCRVRFGNGINGVIPTGTITITYKTGGGVEGNDPAGAIKVPSRAYTDQSGNQVQLSCTNLSQASGGAARMTNAQIKVLAPEHRRATTRSVTNEDFEINARRLSQVARALMLTSDQDLSVPENTGVLYIVPAGGGLPSDALKALVLNQVTVVYPTMATFTVLVRDPVYRSVDIQSSIYTRAGFSKATVKANVLATLSNFFAVSNSDGTANENVDFGANIQDSDGNPTPLLAWSDIFNAIRDTAGVRKIDPVGGLEINGVRSDLTLGLNEFPILGSVVLVDAETGAVLLDARTVQSLV